MKPPSFMLIAGEPSGDLLAAELVRALKESPELRGEPFPAKFFGAGGPRMAAAGVELAVDMTAHSVIGLLEVVRQYGRFKALFDQLLRLAHERRPDVIICVDFSGFNRRFAAAVKRLVRARRGPFHNWQPRIVQYVSPQVWASRPGRARGMERDYDLLLSIFPFEPAWYATHAPAMPVEFVGHPLCERFQAGEAESRQRNPGQPQVVLLPGSRTGELKQHLPVMTEVVRRLARANPATRFRLIVPNDPLLGLARSYAADLPGVEMQAGGLAESLAEADLAITKSGTITLECAFFGVPAVVFYKTSWSLYEIGQRIVRVKYLAMPNLLAGEEIFPEFVQHAATAENIARAALDLLNNLPRRAAVKAKLAQVVAQLGGRGASGRAAAAVLKLAR